MHSAFYTKCGLLFPATLSLKVAHKRRRTNVDTDEKNVDLSLFWKEQILGSPGFDGYVVPARMFKENAMERMNKDKINFIPLENRTQIYFPPQEAKKISGHLI